MSEKFRVLIVDDDVRMSRTLVDIFRLKGYGAVAVESGAEALEKVEDEHFDCVLTDIRMPEMNGLELYRGIKASQPDMPLVLMTAYSTDRLVQEALKEGAIAALTKPVNIDSLFDFFSFLRQEPSIIIVDDEPIFARTLGDVLRVHGFAVTQVNDPHDAVESVQLHGQIVILDMVLNGIGGLEVFKEIRKRDFRVPVVLVTGYGEKMAEDVKTALRIGAHTCLYKPFQMEELLKAMDEIRRRQLRRTLLQW